MLDRLESEQNKDDPYLREFSRIEVSHDFLSLDDDSTIVPILLANGLLLLDARTGTYSINEQSLS